MQKQLSILIPVYNDTCYDLVESLSAQAGGIDGLSYEIIVAEDGSTELSMMKANEEINRLNHCRCIINKQNRGRAEIRNFLAKEAKYEWLIFIDSNQRLVSSNFLENYISYFDQVDVICGGTEVVTDPFLNRNLRYCYEKYAMTHFYSGDRSKHPFLNFRSNNFAIRRNVILEHPFIDTKAYGYEDTLFGKILSGNNVRLKHIDNPMLIGEFESNTEFLQKTQESLNTLYQHKDVLMGFAKILRFCAVLKEYHLSKAYLLLFRCMRHYWESYLIYQNPSLLLLKLYKGGYYLNLVYQEKKKSL